MLVARLSISVLARVVACAIAGAACESTLELGENRRVSGGVQIEDAGGVATDGGPGADTGTQRDSGTPADSGTRDKLLFITHATFTGDFGGIFGGIAGADKMCQDAAIGAGLPGVFRAWISDANTDAESRYLSDGPWREAGSGTIIFDNRAALRKSPNAVFRRDERGATGAPTSWWTGTSQGGTRSSFNCGGWMNLSASSVGMIGTNENNQRQDWTDWATPVCNATNKFALLCLGDDL